LGPESECHKCEVGQQSGVKRVNPFATGL